MSDRSAEEARENLYRIAADPRADVAVGALWIAAEEYPDLPIEHYRSFLAGLAERVAARVSSTATAIEWRRTLVEEIFERENFAGNAADYYDPRNSYLNEVIERRLGIPITLAIVYLSVSRTLGRDARGLGAPGHFLLVDDGVALDPFDRGRVVEREALLGQIQRSGTPEPDAELERLHRTPPDARAILTRMLVNLRLCHLRRGDVTRALAAVDRLVHLDPAHPAWLRDRGALYQRLDCPRAAAKDFEAYLERAPDDPEADVIRAVVAKLSRDLPTLQ